MNGSFNTGGASLPHVTNLIAGDGSGGASDSGVNAALTGAAINPASTGAGTPGTGTFSTLNVNNASGGGGGILLGLQFPTAKIDSPYFGRILLDGASGNPFEHLNLGNLVYLYTTANTLALRNGANAQEFRVYADATNYTTVAGSGITTPQVTIGGGAPIKNVLIAMLADVSGGGANSVAANSYLSVPVVVTGAVIGDRATVSFGLAVCHDGLVVAEVTTGSDVVNIIFFNADLAVAHVPTANSAYIQLTKF